MYRVPSPSHSILKLLLGYSTQTRIYIGFALHFFRHASPNNLFYYVGLVSFRLLKMRNAYNVDMEIEMDCEVRLENGRISSNTMRTRVVNLMRLFCFAKLFFLTQSLSTTTKPNQILNQTKTKIYLIVRDNYGCCCD